MKYDVALGIHFTLAIKAEGLLWLTGQCRTLLLIFIERQASTTAALQEPIAWSLRQSRDVILAMGWLAQPASTALTSQ